MTEIALNLKMMISDFFHFHIIFLLSAHLPSASNSTRLNFFRFTVDINSKMSRNYYFSCIFPSFKKINCASPKDRKNIHYYYANNLPSQKLHIFAFLANLRYLQIPHSHLKTQNHSSESVCLCRTRK